MSRPTHVLHVGDEAPDFCLPSSQRTGDGQRKVEVCLHDFRGRKPVLITFYMAAFTPL